MSIFPEYKYVIPCDDDPLILEFEIGVSLCNRDYIIESTTDYENYLCEKEKNDNSSGFSKWITKISENVSKLLNGLIEKVSSTFSNKKEMNADDFLNSSTGQIQMEFDLQKVHNSVSHEILQGRKIIQSVSQGTGIDEQVVANYLDSAAKAIKSFSKPAIVTAASIACFKSGENKLKKINEEFQSAARAAGLINDSDKKKQSLIRSVYGKMTELTGELGRARNTFQRAVFVDNKK